jgi:hypothetical protein
VVGNSIPVASVLSKKRKMTSSTGKGMGVGEERRNFHTATVESSREPGG